MACPGRIRTARIPMVTDQWEIYLSSVTPDIPEDVRDQGSCRPNEHAGPRWPWYP